MEEKQELIQAYFTLAQERLQVARDLVSAGYYDDAVSRAYYVMFFSAKALLISVGLDTRSHSGVVSQFSQHFFKTGQVDRRYSRILAKAMQAREASDYDPVTRSLLSEAEQPVADADAFLAKMKEILAHLTGEDSAP